MKIFIGADHAGYQLKDEIAATLRSAGHEVTDVGTNGPDSVDYPDFAGLVARAVAAGEADRGILVCFTGVGMSIAANKVQGVRAALAMNTDEISLTRQHNDANVLTIGSKYTTPEAANEYVKVFLETPFEGGRHERRVNKISALEQK
ncbi:MAG: ribose 5-phosphate isomerase B [Bryobacteraceae bacterium]